MNQPNPIGRARTRRELLKMLPLAAAGGLLHEEWRASSLHAGLALNDRIAGLAFRSAHLAPTFSDREVTPLGKFPVNSYLADDPEIGQD